MILRKCGMLSLACLALLLAACMVPEKFTAEYEIKSNGDYTFVYDGTMVDALSRMGKAESAQKGGSGFDPKEIKAMLDEFKADPRVVEFKERGDETYQVRMEEKGNIKEAGKVYFLSKDLRCWTLTYSPDKNTVSLIVSPIKRKDLDGLNIKVDGEFEISTDCKILSSTVELDESLLGSAYSFKISNESATGATVVMQLE